MFVLSFKNSAIDPTRDSFVKYYTALVEIKDFNALFEKKSFFDQPVKNKQEVYEKPLEMSRKNYHTKGDSLDYLHHQNYYKLIVIDLLREINTIIPQTINLKGKLE